MTGIPALIELLEELERKLEATIAAEDRRLARIERSLREAERGRNDAKRLINSQTAVTSIDSD